jgi:hypothetical protein
LPIVQTCRAHRTDLQRIRRANVWRDWDALATTTFGIDQARLNEQATRLEFAGCLTTKVNPLSFYAQAGYQFAVSQTTAGGERNAVMAAVGLRYT